MRIRHEEASRAASVFGAEFLAFDLGDYPLEVGREDVERLADVMRDFQPHVTLTHPAKDPYNPDRPVAQAAVARARLLTAGAGVDSGFRTAPPSEFLAFEPHQPELCEFAPSVFVDIAGVFELKKRAMKEMKAQQYLQEYYAQRAEHRGNHARKVTGGTQIRQAEAFQRILPNVLSRL